MVSASKFGMGAGWLGRGRGREAKTFREVHSPTEVSWSPSEGHARAGLLCLPVQTSESEVHFDVETAIKVLRQAGCYSHAVYLAEKHAHHEWYLKIQLEDIKVRSLLQPCHVCPLATPEEMSQLGPGGCIPPLGPVANPAGQEARGGPPAGKGPLEWAPHRPSLLAPLAFYKLLVRFLKFWS